jgi:hypothetical protein
MGRYALIIVAGLGIIFGITRLNMNRVTAASATIPNGKYAFTEAKNLAHSTAMLCCYQLGQTPTWRVGYPDFNMYGGVCNAQVSNYPGGSLVACPGNPNSPSTSSGGDSVMINASATYQDTTASVQLLVKVGGGLTVPCNLHALLTTRNAQAINGNITLDGRDHNPVSPYTFIQQSGVLGVSTTAATFSCGGSGAIGGTHGNGVDVTPSNDPTVYGSVVQTNYNWGSSGYPTTPDSVMGGSSKGYPEGSLKSTAQNQYNGSQYVTDPSQLTFPLRGVTYVELPTGQTWQPVNFGPNSEGILVVHNQQCNATVENLNSGTFTGIIIGDDIVHIHTNIVGVIFTLTPNPSSGNVAGNGNAYLRYSRQAVQNAIHESGFDQLVTILNYWD